MSELEFEVKGGTVVYQIKENEVRIKLCRIQDSFFEIPDNIDGLPVTGILRKAALGSKTLRELTLPQTLEKVGDWAFANCSSLEQVWIPRRKIEFGKGVFKECKALSRIYFRKEEDEKLAGLFAMVPVMLDAEYLLNPVEAGGSAWLDRLDARLRTLLDRPDEDGYLRQVLCGEEDLMASFEVYLSDMRREKAALCFVRLLNDIGLTKEWKDCLQAYLRANTKGCEYEAAWETVRREHAQDRAYYQAFAEAGCITEENFEELLLDMGEESPEMKAWLLRYREEEMESEDFFAGLSLD